MKYNKVIAGFIIVVLSQYICAETIYQYTNANGVTVFTNKPPKDQKDKKIYIQTANTYKQSSSSTPSNVIDSSLLNIAPANSKQQILQDELSHEKTALSDAKELLEDGKKTRLGSEKNYQRYLDRIQALQNAVTEHEKNIQLLQQQLQNKG